MESKRGGEQIADEEDGEWEEGQEVGDGLVFFVGHKHFILFNPP